MLININYVKEDEDVILHTVDSGHPWCWEIQMSKYDKYWESMLLWLW